MFVPGLVVITVLSQVHFNLVWPIRILSLLWQEQEKNTLLIYMPAVKGVLSFSIPAYPILPFLHQSCLPPVMPLPPLHNCPGEVSHRGAGPVRSAHLGDRVRLERLGVGPQRARQAAGGLLQAHVQPAPGPALPVSLAKCSQKIQPYKLFGCFETKPTGIFLSPIGYNKLLERGTQQIRC